MHRVEEGVRSNVERILNAILHPTSEEETTHTFACTAEEFALVESELDKLGDYT